MVAGTAEIGVRGSTWSRDLNVGPGGPGGVRLPWGNADWPRTSKQPTTDQTRKGREHFITRFSRGLSCDLASEQPYQKQAPMQAKKRRTGLARLQFVKAKAANDVIVDQPCGLHERVADGRTAEGEPALLHVLA